MGATGVQEKRYKLTDWKELVESSVAYVVAYKQIIQLIKAIDIFSR